MFSQSVHFLEPRFRSCFQYILNSLLYHNSTIYLNSTSFLPLQIKTRDRTHNQMKRLPRIAVRLITLLIFLIYLSVLVLDALDTSSVRRTFIRITGSLALSTLVYTMLIAVRAKLCMHWFGGQANTGAAHAICGILVAVLILVHIMVVSPTKFFHLLNPFSNYPNSYFSLPFWMLVLAMLLRPLARYVYPLYVILHGLLTWATVPVLSAHIWTEARTLAAILYVFWYVCLLIRFLARLCWPVARVSRVLPIGSFAVVDLLFQQSPLFGRVVTYAISRNPGSFALISHNRYFTKPTAVPAVAPSAPAPYAPAANETLSLAATLASTALLPEPERSAPCSRGYSRLERAVALQLVLPWPAPSLPYLVPGASVCVAGAYGGTTLRTGSLNVVVGQGNGVGQVLSCVQALSVLTKRSLRRGGLLKKNGTNTKLIAPLRAFLIIRDPATAEWVAGVIGAYFELINPVFHSSRSEGAAVDLLSSPDYSDEPYHKVLIACPSGVPDDQDDDFRVTAFRCSGVRVFNHDISSTASTAFAEIWRHTFGHNTAIATVFGGISPNIEAIMRERAADAGVRITDIIHEKI